MDTEKVTYWLMSKPQAQKMLNCARKFVLVERTVLVSDGPPQPTISIEYRGEEAWAIVIDNMNVLNRDGAAEYEPMPSSRDDEFIARTRFTLEEAWERAEALIKKEGFNPTYKND